MSENSRSQARGFLWVILLALAGNLALALLIKAPCGSGDWQDGRQYSRLCYSDIVPLYSTEHLEGDRLPYLDPCPVGEAQCDEYPVLGMYAMRVAAWPVDSSGAFFAVNVGLLTIAAFAIAIALYLLVGERAIWFALAPTLTVYAYINWDLYAAALTTLATLLFLRRRDGWAGILLGIGIATKLYPLLLVVPFVVERFRTKEPDGGIRLAWGAAGAWLVLNLPFALAAPSGWLHFFRFNSERATDWDSLWFMACSAGGADATPCDPSLTPIVNAASMVLFLGLTALVWRLRARRDPTFPRWMLGFPILVLFLLTSKVYSPQYGIWLLPWFALAFPNFRLFALFEAADVAVFVTRFSFFDELSTGEGLSFSWFRVAVLVRAVILIWCVVVWVRGRDLSDEPTEEPETESETESERHGDADVAVTT